MKLNKNDLIISLIAMIIFICIGFTATVYATNNGTQNMSWNFLGQNNSANNLIQVVETNNTTQNTIQYVSNNTTNTNVANNNTNKVPNTGLEDLPWVVIGICAISAIFAYNKIKEYKNID